MSPTRACATPTCLCLGVTAEALLASLPTLPPSHEADVTAAAAVVAAALGAVDALRSGDDVAAVRLADAAAILGGPDAVAALRPLVAAAETGCRRRQRRRQRRPPPPSSAEGGGGRDGGGEEEQWRAGGPADLSDDPARLEAHPLLEQLGSLAADVHPPPWVPPNRPLVGVHAWVGPPRTHTRLHTDTADNALAQVAGVKVVRLVDPRHTSCLAVPAGDGARGNVAGVDDLVHPAGSGAAAVAAVPYGRVVLRAGDVLHIPAGWWHDVRSVGAAVSVNYWF
ncbi:hypothetical protein I4F81_006869 [Pyropia yezoensis]|uniref:Uncharacterized protein n=1 Tax=Pyropia yezoensis TaxID=2788 RepID=A0ACC3C3J9_PYRYE|nr:hypothetical protein I4F81_006869 [Neopyropia yezoensis]